MQNQFPSPHIAHIDNYAGHMRNFTGSLNGWDF